jgi:hypothetical protein
MTTLDDAKKLSYKLRVEADKLLETTKLSDLLAKYGEVKLGGSYDYNLLVDKDLDFGVAVEKMTPEFRSEIVKTFAMQQWAYSVNMTDRINFKPLSNLNAPRGLYLGITIPFPLERWNIDIWFILTDILPADEFAHQISQATKEQQEFMLTIKYELMKSGKKQKGISSAQVYEAVLTNGIKTTSEFLKSLGT